MRERLRIFLPMPVRGDWPTGLASCRRCGCLVGVRPDRGPARPTDPADEERWAIVEWLVDGGAPVGRGFAPTAGTWHDCRPVRLRAARRWLRRWRGRLGLTAAIVWRRGEDDPVTGATWRMPARTAWEVACIVWD